MTQEVRVLLQLTLDVDTEVCKEEIDKRILDIAATHTWKRLFSYLDMDIVETELKSIQEEAEIYGTEE